MSSHTETAPQTVTETAADTGPESAARRVTVHSGRVRPSSRIAVTPSLATHMAANPPSVDDAEPALHFDLPTAPAVDRPVAPVEEPAGAAADVDSETDTGKDAVPARRWWHRLLFWRRPSGRRASAKATQTGCRLCSWDGDGPCPLGHRR